MADKQFPLAIVIRGVDRITAPLKAVMGTLGKVGAVAAGVSARVRAVGERGGMPVIRAAISKAHKATEAWGKSLSRLGKGLGVLTAAGAGFAYVFKTQFVDTAAEFERFRTILTTLEGSSQKADKSMAWISDFAAKTPFAMKEVTDNFVKLRAYGLQPMDGTLRTLGDTAAAMGKPLESAVEALADAVTGENERLKEFGIKAAAVGNKFVYSYTQNGKTIRVAANKNSREAIQATLMSIWNSKYAGAMDKLSGTWEGMVSNLGDQWDRFKLMVMKNGLFDWLKDKLGGLLAKVDAMAKSGALQKLAAAFGDKLVKAFKAAWRAGVAVANALPAILDAIRPLVKGVAWLADKFGGANVAMAAIAGTIAVTVIPAIYATIPAIYALGTALLTTPIGWIVMGLAALAAGAVYVYRHWEPISRWLGDNLFAPFFGALNAVRSFFSKTWDSITTTFGDAIDWMSKAWDQYNPIALIRKGIDSIMAWLSNWNLGEVIRDKVAAIASYLPNWLKKKLGIADIAAAAPAAGAAAVGAAAAGQGVAAAKNGAVRVQVDFNNTPKGTKVSTEQRGSADFELNQGYAMVGA